MKKIISLLLIVVSLFSVLAIGASAASKYADVEGHWGQTYVDYYSEKGVVNGYPDGTFRPDAKITRAEAAQVLLNYFKFTGKGAGFTDVAESAWYYDAVLASQQNGAFQGYGDGSFKPDNNITREEVIVMLRRITTAEEDIESGKHFLDYYDVCDWAKGSVGALRNVGVLDGYEEVPGSFFVRVHRLITRAEFVKLLFTIEKSEKVEWNVPGEPVQEDPIIISPSGGNGGVPVTNYYTCSVKLWDKADATKFVARDVATAQNYITGTTPVLAEVAKFLTDAVVSDNGGEFEQVFGDPAANAELKQMMAAFSNASTSATAFNAFVDGVTVKLAGNPDTALQTAVKANVAADFDTIGEGVWDIERYVAGSGKTYVVTLNIAKV